jgi:hypothetical protein
MIHFVSQTALREQPMSKNTISASATGLPSRRLFLAAGPAGDPLEDGGDDEEETDHDRPMTAASATWTA